MRRILLAVITAAAATVGATAWEAVLIDAPPTARESVWRDALARLWNGATESHVPGGRVDVLSATEAVEIDTPNHWHEGLGQALHYGDDTGKTPVLALMREGR